MDAVESHPAPGAAFPWTSHEVPEDRPAVLQVGPLALWLRRRRGEVWLAHDYRGASPAGPRPPADREWVRWAPAAEPDRVRLTPAFPDRAVIVKPELPFHLLGGARARVYVRVPLRVRIELPGPPVAVLAEIPTVVLSDTWWGSFVEGELCYWLPTTARRRMSDELFLPHVVACPIQLLNGSTGELHVSKIALRVAHLSIFRAGERLWADETTVRYEGEADESRIDMTGHPPGEAPGAELVTPPRMPAVRGLRARTFARLRALPGLGTHT